MRPHLSKRVFTIILNFNSTGVILTCLSSVKEANKQLGSKEIVIVDNASTDSSIETIMKKYDGIKLLRSSKNLGYAGGNNIGIKYALEKGADFVFMLNPDTFIEKNTIINLLKMINKDEKIGIVGPKIYDLNDKIWSCGGIVDKARFSGGLRGFGEEDIGQYDFEKEVDYIPGTGILIRRKVFETIGFFEEKYFIYYEDVDFCYKAREAGFKMILNPKVAVYHKGSASLGENSPKKEYYMARNHLLFWGKWAPFSVKIRELVRLPKTMYEHYRKSQKSALLGIRDYFLRRFGERNYDF